MFSFLLLSSLIVSSFVSATTTPPLNCNCVVFRIDDIQDYWISASQKAVFDTFALQKTPLTIGIIADSFGKDSKMLANVQAILSDPDWSVEVVNHGYHHEPFSNFTLEGQIQLLTEGRNKTLNDLQGYIDDIDFFVPPFNIQNANTSLALIAAGYTGFSSMVQTDRRPYPLNHTDLYHWPIGASTSDEHLESDFVGVTHNQTMAQIVAQMAIDGFSAVMLHPQEFSNLDVNGNPTSTVNQTMIDELVLLIQAVNDAGYDIVNFRDLPGIFDDLEDDDTSGGSPLTTGSVPISTTSTTTGGASGVILTTGMVQSPLTTGISVPSTSGKIPTVSMTTAAPIIINVESINSASSLVPLSFVGLFTIIYLIL